MVGVVQRVRKETPVSLQRKVQYLRLNCASVRDDGYFTSRTACDEFLFFLFVCLFVFYITKGHSGDQGLPGEDGEPGSPGAPGRTGLPGFPGNRGLQVSFHHNCFISVLCITFSFVLLL